MKNIDVLITGPVSPETGGMARYIDGQTTNVTEYDNITVRTHDTAPPEGSGVLWLLTVFFATVFDVLRFSFRSRPDIVHVHTAQDFDFFRSAFYVLFSKYVWRRPVILHIHGSSFDKFVMKESLPISYFQSVVFGGSDAVIVLSSYWYRTMSLRVPEEKLHIIPNGVDPESFAPEFNAKSMHIVFISDIVERKGIVEFREAITNLCQQRDELSKVTIAGSGPLSHHAEQLAEKHQNVEYIGYISENEKQALLSESSVYVLPSYAEGLPLSLLEAMAGGNAIVTTTVGSIPETVDESNGLLVQPKCSHEITSALDELVTSPETVERMSRRNRKLVESEYTWDSVTQDLVALYRDTV